MALESIDIFGKQLALNITEALVQDTHVKWEDLDKLHAASSQDYTFGKYKHLLPFLKAAGCESVEVDGVRISLALLAYLRELAMVAEHAQRAFAKDIDDVGDIRLDSLEKGMLQTHFGSKIRRAMKYHEASCQVPSGSSELAAFLGTEQRRATKVVLDVFGDMQRAADSLIQKTGAVASEIPIKAELDKYSSTKKTETAKSDLFNRTKVDQWLTVKDGWTAFAEIQCLWKSVKAQAESLDESITSMMTPSSSVTKVFDDLKQHVADTIMLHSLLKPLTKGLTRKQFIKVADNKIKALSLPTVSADVQACFSDYFKE